MRKIFLALFFALLLAISTYSMVCAAPVNAATVKAQEKLQELRKNREELKKQNQERQEQRITIRDDFTERVATKQAEVKKNVVEKIKTIFTRILKRLNAALTRLDKIAERIASRIDKLKGRGVDTTKAETALASAESLGARAASAISDAQAKIDAIDAQSTSVRDAVHASKDAVRSARQALFDYHKGLVAAIREVKAAQAHREGTNSAQ